MMKQKSTVKQRIISGILAVMMIAGIFGTWPIAIFAEGPVAQNAANVWDGSVANGFGGGSGTQADPYLIYTGAELAYLASKTNGGTSYSGKYFKLMNDIDLNNINWTPIGRGSQTEDDTDTSYNLFKGVFDGNNCKIYNLYINASSLMKVGLFGSVANATIKSLGIENASVTMTYGTAMSYGSVLCAAAYNSTISECYVMGSLSATNTKNTAGHNATAGMIVAHGEKITITDCYAEGSVAAISSGEGTYKSYAGGLVGLAASSKTLLNRTYFVGTVSAKTRSENAYAGGLVGCVGSNGSTLSISNSFCSATVSATAGGNYSAYTSAMYTHIDNGTGNQSLSQCYQAGMQTSGTVVNSVTVATLDSFKSDSWLASNLSWNFIDTWTFDASNGYEYPVLQGFSAIGGNGHIHNYTVTIVNPTCDTEGYTEYVCSCGYGYQEDVIPALGHDVNQNGYCTRCDKWINAPQSNIWDGTVANGFGGGSGTQADPYLIYTGAELAYLASSTNAGNSYSGKYFKLMNDIDLNGIEWTPIGHSADQDGNWAFLGSFDGDYHQIIGMTIHNPEYRSVGLFGYIYESSGTIKNLAIVDFDISGTFTGQRYYAIGALAGWLYGNVHNIYTAGVIDVNTPNAAEESPTRAGLLAGQIWGGPTNVNNCFAAGSVSIDVNDGKGTAGGFVGYVNGGQINNSYSVAAVSARGLNAFAGGFAGGNGVWGVSGSISNSFSIAVIVSESNYGDSNYGNFVGTSSGTETNCHYYTHSAIGTENNIIGIEQNVLSFMSQNWLASTLGWDFANIWEINVLGEYTYPMLSGFEPFDGIEIPQGPGICAHEYIETERVEPTCVAEGYIRYTCNVCGGSYEEKIPSPPHEYITEVVEPTCTTDGYNRITCVLCGQGSEEIIPALGHTYVDNKCTVCGYSFDPARKGSVLIVQNSEPWECGSNRELMENLLSDGKITSYKIVSASAFHSENLDSYSVVYVVMNDDKLSASQVNNMYDKLIAYLNVGGTVIYGLCWQSSYSVSLPAGAVTTYGSGYYGTIVDYDHPIITGELTDFVPFPERASGSSLSHTYISTLPANANVILKDDSGRDILVEYAYGSGNVILSCLTWEHFYYHNNHTEHTFSKIAYEDLMLYALALSNGGTGGGGNVCNHNYVETVVAPTCTEDGYTEHVCSLCGDSYKDNYVTKPGHTPGAWIIEQEPTCTTSGRKHSDCTVCGQQLENIYIAPLGHNYVTVVTREVTCTTPGILTHTCERCGDSYITYVYSEHVYAITEQVQPDCYTDGYTVYTCSNCQDQYTEIIPGGHSYKSVITKVATSDEDGEITHTCELCGDYYTEIIPAREAANVLLVQDKYPWSENNNVALLNQMLKDGYITGWDITTTSNFANVDIAMYNVILIANDQTSATYNQLSYLNETLLQFANAGGVVIYGACDNGWSGGNITYSLPEGVVKKNFYSRYNYIVDTDHLIVSGILTDGRALTNNLLYGNYCSHTAFEAATLPAGANVILQDAHGDATLVEYAVGDGHIILSGLTWEFYYNRNCYDGRTNTSYTKNVYDDLIVYALNLSDPCEHIYDAGEVVAPTCTEDGYTLHTCQNCGAHMKDNIIEALGHTEGDWEITVEPTQTTEGLKELRCTVCQEVLRSEVLPPLNGAAAKVESDFDYVIIGDEIVFTLVIENCDPIKSLSVVPVFDADIFDIVSAEWLLMDAMIQDIEEGTYKSVSVWNDYVDVNSQVYRVVLKAKALTECTSVGFSLKVEDKEGVVTVVPKLVSVIECPHNETSAEIIDDTYHACVCNHCGYAVMEEHAYDDIYDVDCNVCGHTRALKGDVDNDGDVDTDDCIYLVYNVFFGTENYPVYQSLDFDGDGIVCSEDGVYLLRYVYYGAGQYPLR